MRRLVQFAVELLQRGVPIGRGGGWRRAPFVELAATAALTVLIGCGSDDDPASSSSASGPGAGAGAASASSGPGGPGAGGTGASSSATGANGTGGETACEPGAAEACYSGPPGTEGVGVCSAGQRVCLEDGTDFGPCDGEVLPFADSCSTLVDEDCDGITPPCATSWVTVLGGNVDAELNDLVVDASDNAVLVGGFSGTLDLGSTTLAAGGGFTVVVGPSGDVVEGLSTGAKRSYGLAVDADGDRTVTGSTPYYVNMLSTITKMYVDGGGGWSQMYGSNIARAESAAVDSQGHVTVAGYFWGAVDYGGIGYSLCNNSNQYACSTIVQLDATGLPVWYSSMGSVSSPLSVAVDTLDNVAVAGGVRGGFSTGTIDLPSAGGADALIVSYDPLGEVRWAQRFGDAEDQLVYDVAVDVDSNVLVVGSFQGTIDFGAGPLTSAGQWDGFAVKIDDGGNVIAGVRFGGPGDDYGYGIAADPSGNVLVTGTFDGTAELGGTTLTGVAGDNVLLAKLDPMLALGWVQGFANGKGVRVGSTSTGDVVLAGSFLGTIDLGAGALDNPGPGDDLFVVTFGP